MFWRARQFEFAFPRPALIMGVVNATPDSFYPGARSATSEAAIQHALRLANEGADIIDIGGESTRPRAEAVPEDEELRRVIPVLQALAARLKIPLSIDTIKPAVALAALKAGASIVNDIAANRSDDAMWRLVAETGAGYILVHMQGTPATMQQDPRYTDVLREVGDFFEDRLKQLRACGVNPQQVALDVGIGFGKRTEDNLQLLAGMGQFTILERPLVLGASRKSFLERLVGATVEERLAPSLACACWAALNGARIIRCHDVAATRHAVRMTELLVNAKHSARCSPSNP